jgi:hypothetical protein
MKARLAALPTFGAGAMAAQPAAAPGHDAERHLRKS